MTASEVSAFGLTTIANITSRTRATHLAVPDTYSASSGFTVISSPFSSLALLNLKTCSSVAIPRKTEASPRKRPGQILRSAGDVNVCVWADVGP